MVNETNFLYDTDRKLFLGIDQVFHDVKEHYGASSPSQSYHILSNTTCPDPYENIGLDFAKALADKIYSRYHDGIATSILLLHSLLKESYLLFDQGTSPYALCHALRKMGNTLLTLLKKQAWPLKEKAKAHAVVFSAVSDAEIATEISDIFSSIGPQGLFSLSETHTGPIRITRGLQIEYGYTSSYFIPHSMQSPLFLSQPCVFVTNKKITSILNFLPLLRDLKEKNTSLLIFCPDIHPDALSSFTVNTLEGLLQTTVVCIGASPDGSLLEDISLFCGTSIFPYHDASKSPFPSLPALGTCDSVEISKEHTMLIQGSQASEILGLKIRQIDEDMRVSSCAHTKAKLLKQKHRLQSSLAIIPVKKETRSVYASALAALSSSIHQGYIPGGGAGLFYASLALDHEGKLTQEEVSAKNILQAACRTLITCIAQSAQLNSEDVITKLSSLATPCLGINLITRQIEDLITSGILDPLEKIEDIFSFSLETALNILLSKAIIRRSH